MNSQESDGKEVEKKQELSYVQTTTTVIEQVAEGDDTTKELESVPENETNEEEPQQQQRVDDSNDDNIVQKQASQWRTKGKELHDNGEFSLAAVQFSKAANLLLPMVSDTDETITEEYATCRLHEALCRLKAEDYQLAVQVCTQVLSLPSDSVAAALRARAFHRRAKARVELGDTATALQDARSAAFLGDRKAVALYGKLMRESPAASSSASLQDFIGSNGSNDLASSGALLESLLSKTSLSSENAGNAAINPMDSFFPSSLLNTFSGITNGDTGSLAKSVLSSLSKRIDDESTQETLCRYLQGASGPQLQQMATMAGVPLQESQASKIASFCQSVTPRMIRRTVKTGKRVLYGIQLVRKVSKVIGKYRNIIIILCILAWTKSAILRPIPVSKRVAQIATKPTTAM